MEPMTLGSPGQSPKPATYSPFLPAFLMGDTSLPSSSTPRGAVSPNKYRSVRFSTNSEMREFPPDGNVLHRSTPVRTKTPNVLANVQVAEKSGPPVIGLFDTLERKNTTINMSTFDGGSSFGDVTDGDPLNISNTVANRSVFDGSDDDDDNGHWVTVFGFPPQAISLIIQQFSTCGTILAKKIPANNANWMHVKYGSAYEASKALKFHGKFLASNMMIGVIPHEVAGKENSFDRSGFASGFTSVASGVTPSVTPGVASNVPMNVTPCRTARPLVSAPFSPDSSIRNMSMNGSVMNDSHFNAPQQSTGFVSKAMEYVFGW